MKRIIFMFIAVLVLFSGCEKYKEEIFIDKYQRIYGDWISSEKCGGWTGGCTDYEGERLRISEYGKFEIKNDEDEVIKGHIIIWNQDETKLRITLNPQKAGFMLFSYLDLNTTFQGEDTLIFAEDGCDTFTYTFIRTK